MKKKVTLAIALAGMMSLTLSAQDYTVLTSPEDIYANSVEDVAGAKAAYGEVINNAASTDDEKTAAMQEYVLKASPKAGYAFDLNFLLQLASVNDDNKGKFTQAALAEAWSCDVPGVVFGSNSVFTFGNDAARGGYYMRVNAPTQFKAEDSYNKFAAYQTVSLAKGSYELKADGFVNGLAGAATLAAGDIAESGAFAGQPLKPYSVNFKMEEQADVKLGFKRNDKAGSLNFIAFNNMELYKVSNMVQISDNATAGLSAATGVDVELAREFTAGVYYPLTLPFIVYNWKDVFDDVKLWSNYDNNTLTFSTLAGANTQARKPYLVKFKTNVDANNYMVFNNVDVAAGNAGSWIKSVAEGEVAFPVKMVGNWAAGTVPANCYYLDGDIWRLSDGSAPLTSFSAYIDATGLTEHPATMASDLGNGNTTVIEVVDYSQANALVTVYNVQGIAVRKGVRAEEALEDLPAGLYIVNGKKFIK